MLDKLIIGFNSGYSGGNYGGGSPRPRYNTQSYRSTTSRQVPPPPTGGSNSGARTVTTNTNPNVVDNNGWPNDTNPYPSIPTQNNNYSSNNSSNLPPRQSGSGSIMNMKAVEETPIAEISYDDTAAIDAIFDEN